MRFIKMIIVDPNEEPDFIKYMDKIVERKDEFMPWYKENLNNGKVRYLQGVEQKIKPEDISRLVVS